MYLVCKNLTTKITAYINIVDVLMFNLIMNIFVSDLVWWMKLMIIKFKGLKFVLCV